MNTDSQNSPILIIPYMWLGDFVRCHSVVKVLCARWPQRPIDLLTSSNAAPLLDYMPGVRKGVVADLPRGRIPIGAYRALARRVRAEGYGTALLMLRTWKAALIPFLAGIPERTGFVGEWRFALVNDLRFGERRLKRMIDVCGSLALPRGAAPPAEWPLPELVVPPAELAAWRARVGEGGGRAVALAPGAVGAGKRWPTERFAELARLLTDRGLQVWVLGGPNEAPLARAITAAAGPSARDLTGTDLSNAILALRAADAAVTNDSGLMHIAAALGTPTVALFGPTDPALWGPLNPLAATIEPPGDGDVGRRRIEDIAVAPVLRAVELTLAR